MGTVFSGILALPLLFALAPLISWLPLPALSGILLLISFRMIDIEAIRLCVVATSIDRAVLLITFLSTLLFDLEKAIFIGVLLSLTLFIYKTAHPRVHRLHKGDPMLREGPAELPQGITVYMIEGTLFFGAIHELERLLYEEDSEPTKLVVLHLSRVFWIDASGHTPLHNLLSVAMPAVCRSFLWWAAPPCVPSCGAPACWSISAMALWPRPPAKGCALLLPCSTALSAARASAL